MTETNKMVYTYYGNFLENQVPHKRFDYMLLDEHLQKLVDKNVERFKKDCAKIYADIRKENRDQLRQVKKDIIFITKQLNSIDRTNFGKKFLCETRGRPKVKDKLKSSAPMNDK